MSLDDAVMHTHYTVTSMDLAHFYQMHNLKQLRFRGLEAENFLTDERKDGWNQSFDQPFRCLEDYGFFD